MLTDASLSVSKTFCSIKPGRSISMDVSTEPFLNSTRMSVIYCFISPCSLMNCGSIVSAQSFLNMPIAWLQRGLLQVDNAL